MFTGENLFPEVSMVHTGFFRRGRLLLALLLFPSLLFGHVSEGAGEALQLYSYRITGLPPVIDGSAFSRNGNPDISDAPDEWKEAYIRQITLSDNTKATLLLCNTDDTLYIAVNYDHGNNSEGSGVYLYFDEGDNASEVGDGSHDHLLTNSGGERNEAGYALYKDAAEELSWADTGWATDGDGGSLQDFNGARYFFSTGVKNHSHEFAIPLKTTTPDDANNSDLQICVEDELGFYLKVVKEGSGAGEFHWNQTNGDVTVPSGWADLKLNVDNRFFAFYGTYAANGSPTVDGSLKDDAWRGCYRRDIILTNFMGETVDATIYATQHHGDNIVYFGVEVHDSVENAGDYIQLYFEDSPGAASTDRDYYLDTNSNIEDALMIQGNSFTDYYWNSATPDFEMDLEGADQHSGKAVFASNQYTYEAAIPYQAGAQDIDVDDGGIAGMIIRYFDADGADGEREFYWDFGANTAGVKIDPNSDKYLAIGWPALQLGAPYVQVIFPEDQKSVEGVVNVRVAAIDENADGIDSAYFYRPSDTSKITMLTKVADTDEFSGTWDVSSLPNGVDTLVIVVVDDDGIKIDRLVEVTVNNTGGLYKEPVIGITSPQGGTVLSGDVTLNLSVTPGASSLSEFYLLLDGDSIALANSATSYTLSTAGYRDGVHTIQFFAKNSEELSSLSQIYSFTFANSPGVTINTPSAGEAINGTYAVTYTATTPSVSTVIAKREISVDGSDWDSAGLGESSYSLVTTALENGTHTVMIRLTDNSGNGMISLARSFVVDNEAPIAADPRVIIPGTGEVTNLNSAILITALIKDNIVGLADVLPVMLTSDAINSAGVTSMEMKDDGTGGDIVAGDNVFTASVTVATDSSGLIDFTVTATDKLGNSASVTSTVMLDNRAPIFKSFDYHPDPEPVTASSGVVYSDRIIARGSYSDSAGSGIYRASIAVQNGDGDYVNNSPIELTPEDSLFSRIVELVPGVNIITSMVEDKAGNSTTRIDTITYIEPKATTVIGSDGGVVSSQNGVSVSVPANALIGSEEITITRVDPEELPEPESDDVVLLGVPFEFGPDGQSFRKPVTITLTYTEADLDRDMDGEADLDVTKLGAVFWDGEKWHLAGDAVVDTVNRTVTISVNHFTVFDIAELTMDAPSELITYWSENPISAQKGSLFNYRIPSKGTVSLMILDLAGELVYQVIGKETPVEPGYYSVAWYGKNVAERRAAPGIYVSLFVYTPEGGSAEIIRKPIGLLK